MTKKANCEIKFIEKKIIVAKKFYKAAGVLDGLAPGGGPDHEAGLAELSRHAGLDGRLGGLPQIADALGLEGLPGEMDDQA